VSYRQIANVTQAAEKIDAALEQPRVPALDARRAAVMVEPHEAQVAQTAEAETYRNAPAAGLAANTIAAVDQTACWVVKVV
jgi:hypothetical protein